MLAIGLNVTKMSVETGASSTDGKMCVEIQQM